ncbi:hypothetical protein BDV34DRAFT_196249 [Aspergillus parasiticus]|uniref:Uncharacterized protein n=1 Tax=Aspergillus parasiticus TaxID=5067 RepID=A0A5N6DJB0_ASPPA|nr:hypothetical protein BDV34DRAFT_196249 [Aspergillus parasiticus]
MSCQLKLPFHSLNSAGPTPGHLRLHHLLHCLAGVTAVHLPVLVLILLSPAI